MDNTGPDFAEGTVKLAQQADDEIVLDKAELFLREHNYDHTYILSLLEDKTARKKLIRRVDFILMPLLCFTYLLQFIDKQALAFSASFDLFTSTGISTAQYSWLVSIFYFAYLVAEWPASYLAQKYPTGTIISSFIFVWGSILMLTTACTSFSGLAACRFFLGCFEAVITPAFMMIIGMWYSREEQPARAGVFFSFNGVAQMVSGMLFYGVGQAKGFPIWRIIFLLCGGVTVLWGILLYFLLPNNIITAKRFSNEDKAMLIAQGQLNTTGVYNNTIKIAQIKEALGDVQVWLLFFFMLLNEVINGGYSSFYTIILKSIAGGNALESSALTIPGGAVQALFILSAGFLASRFPNIRTILMGAYLVPTIIGVVLLWKLDRSNIGGLLAGYYIAVSFCSSLVLGLQMPATNVAGYTKRVTATAMVFLAYCAGNIIGPHAFIASEAPQYATAVKVIIGCSAGQIVIAAILRYVLIRRNRERDAMELPPLAADEDIMMDLTDFENLRFRYVY
ncbi:MFS allantoate transporter [Xylariales sp. PMI_506]|nr:MFS allantoate transporter [Xylariales sp. PMI_506]